MEIYSQIKGCICAVIKGWKGYLPENVFCMGFVAKRVIIWRVMNERVHHLQEISMIEWSHRELQMSVNKRIQFPSEETVENTYTEAMCVCVCVWGSQASTTLN